MRNSIPSLKIVKRYLNQKLQLHHLPIRYVGAGTNVMAQTINAGANPGYAWYVNGTLQAGQNSASLPISPLINSQVQCILTTSEQCYIQQKDTSNTINVTVNPLPLASITALGNTTFAVEIMYYLLPVRRQVICGLMEVLQIQLL